MRIALAILITASLHGQTPSFSPLHVSPEGNILNSSGQPVLLLGLNRSGTGSGSADATATDADYAAQNQLLSMNLVRIFVNANWWNNNVQVPIANQPYRTYIDTLIQRAKKYGSYVLILKAGQFPDAPCGANGVNCPAPNQGDLNCASTPSLCPAQSTSGAYIDVALAFWDAFAQKYATDPAVLYDTWENMSGLDPGTWSDNENALISTIRTYNPQSLIFVQDTGSAFEAITAGTIPDLAWSNLVWNFHLYNASTATCTEPASPRYANWSQQLDPLVSYAQQNGHAVAFTEWGGCNDVEPYNTNITSYAQIHSIALVYFDSSNVMTQGGNDQLTPTGTKVAQAYSAIAAGASAPGPAITLVANAYGDTPLIAPNTWLEIKGSNLAPAGDTRIWQGPDFFSAQMPEQLDGVSVTVNGTLAYVYYISPTQVNVLSPPNAILGPVQVQLTNNGVLSNSMSVAAQPESLSLFAFFSTPSKSYVYGRHTSDNTIFGPPNLFPGLITTPVKPNESIYIAGNGFGPTDTAVVAGSVSQTGSLPQPWPVIKIGNMQASVSFAGLGGVGTYQINLVVPANVPSGDQPITVTYNGLTSQANIFITVQ